MNTIEDAEQELSELLGTILVKKKILLVRKCNHIFQRSYEHHTECVKCGFCMMKEKQVIPNTDFCVALSPMSQVAKGEVIRRLTQMPLERWAQLLEKAIIRPLYADEAEFYQEGDVLPLISFASACHHHHSFKSVRYAGDQVAGSICLRCGCPL